MSLMWFMKISRRINIRERRLFPFAPKEALGRFEGSERSYPSTRASRSIGTNGLRLFILVLLVAMILTSGQAYADYEQYMPEDQLTCCYQNGNWLVGGQDKVWWEHHYPGAWYRFSVGAQPTPAPSFADISEQPLISGFEQETYNSPK